MSRPQTPYSTDLGDRDPVAAMEDAVGRISSLVANWAPAQFERSYAPGKWSARTILIHLAESEIALGNRARMALAKPGYTAQAFDQDQWIAVEGRSGGSGESGGSRGSSGTSGPVALQALAAMNAFNRALFGSLSESQRATPFTHPEYGALTVDWLIHQMGGHLLHHVVHFETIAAAR
jgi:hypothetical protein